MGMSWKSQTILGSGLILGGKKRLTKLEKQSSSHLWIHSVTTQMKRNLMIITSITLFFRKYITKLIGTQSICSILYTIIQSAGSRIATLATNIICNHHCATVPGDCIYRVISQNGDRVLFERLATPRPAPNSTLKSNWHTQQQQQRTLREGVNSISEEIATCESKARVRDETKNSSSVEVAVVNSMRTVSKVDVCTRLSEQEVITDAFSNNESQEIERVKIGSNKICIREDLVKEKMVFSKESSRSILEMGNVEPIELKNSSIQCPSCIHYGFEGTFFCKCGKLMNPGQDVMNWIKEVFEILKAPNNRTSQISTGGSKCGPNPWQHQHQKARDALRSAAKGGKTFTSIWERWQHDEIYKKSQLSHY